jgi:hypothetical protein
MSSLHRQGSLITLPDDDNDDQRTVASDSLQFQPIVDQPPSSSRSSPNESVSIQSDPTTSFGFQQTNEQIAKEIDYATVMQTNQLYFDPTPEIVRKPQLIKPIVYKQSIAIKFLKPPSIELPPLIVREVRPPQPPPPPPLVRQCSYSIGISMVIRLFGNILRHRCHYLR